MANITAIRAVRTSPSQAKRLELVQPERGQHAVEQAAVRVVDRAQIRPITMAGTTYGKNEITR